MEDVAVSGYRVVREEAYVVVGRQGGRNGFTDKKEVRLG